MNGGGAATKRRWDVYRRRGGWRSMDFSASSRLARGGLGGEAFRERMQKLIEDKPLTGVPRQQAHPTRPAAEQIIDAVSQTYGIRAARVLDRSCQAAFRSAVYLLRRAVNLSLGEVSTLAGVSISRVSQIQRNIEAGHTDERLRALTERYQVKN